MWLCTWGYDLLNLKQYDELLQLTAEYDQILPKEPDIPLLAGYVHKQAGQLEEAQEGFQRSAGSRSQSSY